MGFRPLGSCKPPSLMSLKNHNHNLVRHHDPHFYHYGRRASPSDHHHWIFHSDSQQKTTQCQLCKRLTWPIFPLSWSSVAWKIVSPWMWSPFSCVLGHFWHGDNQPNKQLAILVQACSWPVWEGSLLQFLVRVEGHSHKMLKLLYQLLLTTEETPGLEDLAHFDHFSFWSLPTQYAVGLQLQGDI